jgi:hypothetical protein
LGSNDYHRGDRFDGLIFQNHSPRTSGHHDQWFRPAYLGYDSFWNRPSRRHVWFSADTDFLEGLGLMGITGIVFIIHMPTGNSIGMAIVVFVLAATVTGLRGRNFACTASKLFGN